MFERLLKDCWTIY